MAGSLTFLQRVRRMWPSVADYGGLSRSWRTDVMAGITVGVVALPLALGFGVASGAGAGAGLVTAIVAGLVAGVFGGSSVQVSGPTGAMAVVLLPIVHHYGVGAIPLVGFIGGTLLLAAGLLGAGKALTFVPWPLIEGFTVGIAVVIALQQVPNALGVTGVHGSTTVVTAWEAFYKFVRSPAWTTVAVTVATLVLLAVLHRVRPSWPTSLLVVVLVTASTANVHALNRIGSLPRTFGHFHWPSGWTHLSNLMGAAFAVAVLAGLESLLSAKVADGLADHSRHHPNRELVGQGFANLASALFGGVPATGAIARTAVNVRAGARTRLAAITHSVVLLIVALFAASLVARIPLPVLAGILIMTAWRMVERRGVLSVLRSTKGDALVLIVTAALTIAVDLITAVEIGLALASVVVLANVARSSSVSTELLALDDDEERDAALLQHRIVIYRLEGAMFFGVAERFLATMAEHSQIRVVILRMPQLQYLDATGARALGNLIEGLSQHGVRVLLKGVRPEHERLLRQVGTLDEIIVRNHLFTDLDAAIAHARHHARRSIDHDGEGAS